MSTNTPSNDTHILRSGVVISSEQDQALNDLLAALAQKIPAYFALLVDTAGQTVCAKGDHDSLDLVMLGSLVAGDLAASQEIGHLMGEYEAYQSVYREGAHSHLLICEAGPHLALMVRIDREVPLGWARMLVLDTAKEMAIVMATAVATDIPIMLEPEDNMSADELSDLIGDALDDLWLE